MLDAIYAAISGLRAHQVRLDVVSNNLANVNTTAFKKGRVSFEDLVRRPATAVDRIDQSRDPGEPVRAGLGTMISKSWSEFAQGDLRQTERALDLAIQGRGFFEVELADGRTAYTRTGSFQLNEAGELVTATGDRLVPATSVPPDTLEIRVSGDGVVLVTLPNVAAPVEVGQIDLVTFVNPSGLRQVGDGLFEATEDSGEPYVSEPGAAGAGMLRQGFLEASNVDFVQELVELVTAQRAYQLNSRALQAADEILAEINGLRR